MATETTQKEQTHLFKQPSLKMDKMEQKVRMEHLVVMVKKY